jgi:hypothetical protein
MGLAPRFLAHAASGRYSAGVPRPARLLLAVTLAFVALSPSARADEHAVSPAGGHRHRHRRAKLEEPAGRAGRSGGSDAAAEKVPTGFHAKHLPAERAESVGSPNDGHLQAGSCPPTSRATCAGASPCCST